VKFREWDQIDSIERAWAIIQNLGAVAANGQISVSPVRDMSTRVTHEGRSMGMQRGIRMGKLSVIVNIVYVTSARSLSGPDERVQNRHYQSGLGKKEGRTGVSPKTSRSRTHSCIVFKLDFGTQTLKSFVPNAYEYLSALLLPEVRWTRRHLDRYVTEPLQHGLHEVVCCELVLRNVGYLTRGEYHHRCASSLRLEGKRSGDVGRRDRR